MGAANGFLVARMKLPPFIVTLGTWQIILAANYLYSANETIRSQDIEADGPAAPALGLDLHASAGTTVSLGVVLLVIIVLIMAYVLQAHRLGPARLRHRRRPRGGQAVGRRRSTRR